MFQVPKLSYPTTEADGHRDLLWKNEGIRKLQETVVLLNGKQKTQIGYEMLKRQNVFFGLMNKKIWRRVAFLSPSSNVKNDENDARDESIESLLTCENLIYM